MMFPSRNGGLLKSKNVLPNTQTPPIAFIKEISLTKQSLTEFFADHQPAVVVNLGAQAGVRYSITNPDAYIQSNMIGFYNILEACRHSYDNGASGVEHLVYASSSSVYGTNKKNPILYR